MWLRILFGKSRNLSKKSKCMLQVLNLILSNILEWKFVQKMYRELFFYLKHGSMYLYWKL